MAININTFISGIGTVIDLINNATAHDTVGIFDGTSLEQLFYNARPLKADVKETSQIMNHPVESGTILSDNHIINPTEINLSLIIKSEFYNSMYSQIRQAFIAATRLSVSTRTGVYNNLIIADMPHQEEPEAFNAIIMALHLKEVLFALPISISGVNAPANYSPVQPSWTNTVNAGLKYSTPDTAANAVIAQSILTASGFKILSGLKTFSGII